MRSLTIAILTAAAVAIAGEPPGANTTVAIPHREVRTAAIPAPSAEPVITLPAIDSATLDWLDSIPVLMWQAIPGATGYEIQRWKISGAGGKPAQWKTQGYTMGLSWVEPKPPRKPAYYRLRAIQAGLRPSYSPWTSGLLYAPPEGP